MSEAVKGGRGTISRESVCSAALVLVEGAASIADFTDRAVGGPLQCYFNLLALQTSL